MQIGVILEKSPADWEILQQHSGSAAVVLAGRYVNTDKTPPLRVYARVVREATGEPVILWAAAEMGEAQTWSLTLANVPAGGLYRIETCLVEENGACFEDNLRGDMRHHIGVGDLFVIAGQSNAAGTARDFVTDEPMLGVHALKVSGKWDLATHPLNEATDTIHEANREPCTMGNSPFLNFGKYLKKELHYPIGLIPTALGGSALSEWLPQEDGTLFRNMMEILQQVGKSVAGILWYQGCTDADTPKDYEKYEPRFASFVQQVRQELGFAVPFFTVQLNRRIDVVEESCNTGWSMVREAQRQAAKNISQVYITPAIDGSLSDCIHNNSAFQLVLGERLAKQVLAKLHKKPFLCDAPDLQSATVTGNRITLSFCNVTHRLDAFGIAAAELLLQIQDETGEVPIVSYTLLKQEIMLELARVPQGKCYVSNACGSNPHGHSIIDFGTHYPLMAFWKVSVQKQ